jgi:transcriptional regulator with PAS, ATPase and Fis domain
MEDLSFIQGFPGAVTVCDPTGKIIYMNDKSAVTFAADGGFNLIGSNLLDCHPEPSRRKLEQLMAEQRANVYTIEKKGVHKLIYQTPWFKDGKYAGFVELSLEIPAEMPHFIRSN